MFRDDSTAAASERYEEADKRKPNKAGDRSNITNHKTGEAIDVDSNGFVMKIEAMINLIALSFGLVRPVPGEQWHFEINNHRDGNAMDINSRS